MYFIENEVYMLIQSGPFSLPRIIQKSVNKLINLCDVFATGP